MESYAVITGSSRGLGYEIAKEFAENGFNVVITGRNTESLKKSCTYLKKNFSVNIVDVEIDFMDESAPKKFYALLHEKNIKPSIIVHNLGGKLSNDQHPIITNVLQKTLRFNLEIGIELNNLFYADISSIKGKIIHIGSTASLHFRASPCYTISKSALHSYVKNISNVYAKDGVCIFGILPGMLDHEGSEWDIKSVKQPNTFRKIIENSPYGCLVSTAEIAKYVVNIAKVKSTMINGEMIKIDGGYY